MTTDKLICAVEPGKYEGATFVVSEEYIMESMFLAKLFIRVGFNVVTEIEDNLYLHALFLDLSGLGGVSGCWLDTGYMLSSGQEGAAPLIVHRYTIITLDCNVRSVPVRWARDWHAPFVKTLDGKFMQMS